MKLMRDEKSVSPLIGTVIMLLITVVLAAAILKYSNVFIQSPPSVALDVELYTVNKANATKVVVKDLGGNLYFKNRHVWIFLNGQKFDFRPFTERGYLSAGDVGILVVPYGTKVNKVVTVKLAIGGTIIFSDEYSEIFYSKRVIVQKAKQIENGLLAEWHFEEGVNQLKNDPDGDGYTIYDLSGRNINGGFTYGFWSNDNYVNGINGKAIHFDGVNDYVWIDYSLKDKISPTKQVTYEAWIYPEDTSKLQDIILNGAWYRRVIVGYGKIGFELMINNQDKLLWSNTNIQPNKWYYVVATYDGSKMKLYINGKLDSELPASGSIGSPYTSTYIGAQPPKEYFNGTIDEVYIWDRALTPKEIKERYEMYANSI